jgi:hypothetical protein
VSPTANLANPPSVSSLTAVLQHLTGWQNRRHQLQPHVSGLDPPHGRANKPAEGEGAEPHIRSHEPLINKQQVRRGD